MGIWDEIIPTDNLEPYLQSPLQSKHKWRNIQQTDKGFIAYARQYNKQIYLGLFATLEEAINAQEKFKYTGETSHKKQDPLDALPSLLDYYFQSAPQTTKHSLNEPAQIECGNEIGYIDKHFPSPSLQEISDAVTAVFDKLSQPTSTSTSTSTSTK